MTAHNHTFLVESWIGIFLKVNGSYVYIPFECRMADYVLSEDGGWKIGDLMEFTMNPNFTEKFPMTLNTSGYKTGNLLISFSLFFR